MQLLALSGSLVIAVQLIYGLVNGSIICLNEGCRVVEGFTAVSPLYFNILGFVYFLAVYWSLRSFKNKSIFGFDLPGLLLLSGLAAEGVLLAYQLFVVRVFCSYCILIFVFVILLNLMHSRKQLISGVTILIAIIASFSLLTFMPAQVFSQFYSLNNGTYGVKTCSDPSKEIYLIFSSDCSHCENVIQTLENCNSCELHLNPVDKIDALKFRGLELNPNYSMEVNRLMLAMLGIKEVPVLVVKNMGGYSFIKGEKKILDYVNRACFNQQPVLYFDQSVYPEQKDITVMKEDGEECSLELDCDNQ